MIATVTANITFHQPIDGNLVQRLTNNLGQVNANPDIKEVYLAFSSPGGEVKSGLHLYNFLRGLPIKITAHNLGNMDSAGTIVYLAAENRLCSEQARFLFHGITFPVDAKSAWNIEMLKGKMSELRSDEGSFSSIIASRSSGINKDAAASLFRGTHIFDANTAVKHGIAHSIAEYTLPDDTPANTIPF